MNLKELKKNSKLGQSLKLNNRALIAALIMILISAIFFGWAYVLTTSDKGTPQNFSDLLASQSIKEGIYTSLTVTEEPHVFAEYDDNLTSDKFYFLWNGDLLHIGYLDYSTYSDLKSKAVEVDSPTIFGVTKKIPLDVIDIAIETYNEAVGETFLTKDNYSQYIGTLYIDVVSPVQDNTFQLIFGFVFLLLGVILLVTYIVRQKQTKKGIRSRSESEWKKIFSELDSDTTKSYKKINLYLTENYIVDLGSGLRVIEYKDIVWMYQFQMKRYGMTVSKNIVLATKNKEKISIANMDNFMKRSKKDFSEIMNYIVSKNEGIVLGYTKENKKQMKDLYGIK